MSNRERRFLLSERATLEKMLDEISPKSVIGRMSLEQRKEEVEERIAALEREPVTEEPPADRIALAHDEHSAALLAHAQEMIDKGDRLQASEKIWGAVAHKVKGIARRRGWGWNDHDGVRHVVTYFRNRTRNHELGTLLRSANDIHVNFYNDELQDQDLADGLADAKKLIALLDDADASVPETDDLPYGVRRLVPRTARRSRHARTSNRA